MNRVSIALLKSFITNLFLSITKILIGIIGSSQVMIADGFNSLSDLSTDIIAILGNYISRKPADKKHPYGYGQAEYLTNIIIGIVIIFMSITLIINAFSSSITVPNNIVIYICIITIVVKVIIANYLMDEGYNLKNDILVSSGKESMMNVLSSFFALITIILALFSKKYPFLKYADLIGTIIVSLIILYTGINILIDSVGSILGKQEDDKEYVDKITKIILKDDRIKKIDKLNIIKYGSYYQVELVVLVSDKLKLTDSYKIQKDLRKRLIGKRNRIHHLQIVVNPFTGG